MPGKILSDLLIQFLIPQIMVHYLKLSKDSDCSLAMAHGLLGCEQTYEAKGKRTEMDHQSVSPALSPGFREKSPTFNFSCPQHFYYLFLSLENCWINEVNAVGRKIMPKERMEGREENRKEGERKKTETYYPPPQVLQQQKGQSQVHFTDFLFNRHTSHFHDDFLSQFSALTSVNERKDSERLSHWL